jgi:hypothetical protein
VIYFVAKNAGVKGGEPGLFSSPHPARIRMKESGLDAKRVGEVEGGLKI